MSLCPAVDLPACEFTPKGFKKYGFTTTIAADGAQALKISQTNTYDAILLDLGWLPIKDGWTVLKALRDRGDRSSGYCDDCAQRVSSICVEGSSE
ncbi:MAG: hypothetical protein AAF171_21355 [Cyanobacteria bacterium P01_A01_bin.116]